MDIKKFLKMLFLTPLLPIIGVVGDSDGEDDNPNADPQEGQTSKDGGNNVNDDDSSDDGEDTDSDEPDEDDSKDDEKPPEQVPLKTYLEMKAKFLNEKKKNAALEDSKVSEELRNKKEQIKQMFIKKGYEESAAEDMAEFGADMLNEINKDRQTNTDKVLDEEINELAKDSFFSDIGQYRKEIKSFIAKSKKAGLELSVEQAYLMNINPNTAKTKFKEAQTRNEVIESAKNKNNNSNDTMPTASGQGKNNQYNLDDYDKKALEMLKQMQPEYQWTAKKYIESKKRD